jgi:polysaccharide export outer membrane protein
MQIGTRFTQDTLTVRAGKIVQLVGMDDLKLEGVLRSELNDKFSAHVSRYIREPTVKVLPLLRVQLNGAVGRPGYYYSSADVLLADIVMAAGGPTPDADLKKVVIRRGADVIWTESDTRTALSDGLSLDRLSLRAGDEVFVGRIRRTQWLTYVQVGVSLFAILLTVGALR